MKQILTILFVFAFNAFCSAQTAVPVFKGAIKENRDKFLHNTIEKTIKKNLALPLTDSTEENWLSAFSGIELLNYQPAFVQNKLKEAASKLSGSSVDFQKRFWTVCYKRQPLIFAKEAKNTFDTTTQYKLMVLSGEYLLADETRLKMATKIYSKIEKDLKNDSTLNNNPFYTMLAARARMAMGFGVETAVQRAANLDKYVPGFFHKEYLPGKVIVYSFQRKNRNYPGIALVRRADGSLVKNSDSSLFFVPQLARSTNNLPGYLTNGNTPQGVFRMFGFGISTLSFIGPTENLQLMMPVEISKPTYFNDSTREDSPWELKDYTGILPQNWRKNFLLYEAYFAGLAGRTEIIAHGTTVNPEFYKVAAYYPHTPTSGCLCTKEFWSNKDGKRTESNQQKLVDAVKQAGGADGYLIVLELEDEQRPVILKDVLKYIKK